MASFHTLPLEIWDLIATNLDLRDYLHFCTTCRQTRSRFGSTPLTHILKSIEALHGEELEECYENCQLGTYHDISRGHILSYAFRENGVTPGLNKLGQRGASLKYVPCGGLVESAAQSNDYQRQLSWLIHHGASYLEVRGGINRLCRESYDKGDFERFRWLFPNGASLDILAETVSEVPSRPGPRTVHALRNHRYRLMKALRTEDISRAPRRIFRSPRISRAPDRIPTARHARVHQ